MKITGKITDDVFASEETIKHFLNHKIPRVWIVIADNRIARIFRKVGKRLELIGEALSTPLHLKKGTPDNSMGRVVSYGGSRHKLEPHEQPGNADAINFANDLSLWLERAVQHNFFDRLVIVAAPKTLGNLRQRLGKSVLSRVSAEMNKELTKFNEKDLEEELKEILWF